MQPIAVAFVHGIEIDDPAYADTPIRLLRDGFARAVGLPGVDPEEALVVKVVDWAAYVENRQRDLFERMYPQDVHGTFDGEIIPLIRRINSGSVATLLPLMATLGWPLPPSPSALAFPAGRWLMMHFIGDVIAYDRAFGPTNYAAAHAALGTALAALAEETGPDAPLCVIAHSFGTVLVSDYVYDQQESTRAGRTIVPDAVGRSVGSSALARGETLGWLYTMGSPLALWSLRYPPGEMTKPIRVPGALVAAQHPDLPCEWVNYYSPQDVIAYPLRPLSEDYEEAVSEDRSVSLTYPPFSFTPLVHPYYWADESVMGRIAARLASAWRELNV